MTCAILRVITHSIILFILGSIEPLRSKLLRGIRPLILSLLFLLLAMVALMLVMDIVTWTIDWEAAIVHFGVPGNRVQALLFDSILVSSLPSHVSRVVVTFVNTTILHTHAIISLTDIVCEFPERSTSSTF
jgi:hypothetical protein